MELRTHGRKQKILLLLTSSSFLSFNHQTIAYHTKSKRIPKNIYFCFVDYAKAFNCVDHNKLWNILTEMGLSNHPTCLLRNLYAGQELTARNEQWIGPKLGKEYIKAIYCHPVYLTSMQSTSCEMLDWMKDKLELRLPGEISTTSDMQMIPL